MPWARMHRETLSAWAIAFAEACTEELPPPGTRRWQDRWAASNAGDSGSAAMLLTSPPPTRVGSEKFGTPWERMHCAKSTRGEDPVEVLLLGLEDAPHALLNSPQLITTASRFGMAPHRTSRPVTRK